MKYNESLSLFTKHYQKYDTNDLAIVRKYNHSLRVAELAEQIAISSGASEEDIELAKIAGLLHDYSRFEQWTRYKTYSDIASIDHGDLAVMRLFSENEIVDYPISKEDYDAVYTAIKCHNKIAIPENINEKTNWLSKVVRDADKIDIFYILGFEKPPLTEEDKQISDNVKRAFYNHQMVSYKDLQNKNDKSILSLAMIYDLQFIYSYEYLKEKKLIEEMYKQIGSKEIFKEYFEYIIDYITKKVEIKKIEKRI